MLLINLPIRVVLIFSSISSVPKANVLYLIYDGECPVCSKAAQILRIRKSVGKLEIINARTKHLLVEKAKKEGYNLNEGIIVVYNGKLYYGSDAMNFLAMMGSPVNFINKLNVVLLRSKFIASILYPIFKFMRRCLLFLLGVQEIKPDTTQPIFKSVFADSWEDLPNVFKKKYSNKAFSNDVQKLSGEMDIKLSKIGKFIAPLFKLLKVLVPFEGKNIPVTVYCKTSDNNDFYLLERYFYISGAKPYITCSKFIKIKGAEIVEITKFGLGWRCDCIYSEGKIRLIHKGFVWKVFGILIPMPISYLLGRGYAEESGIDDHNFRMLVTITHPWFGHIFEYNGQFKVV